jgi:CRISPR-associated endonuclease/helicase Cas3
MSLTPDDFSAFFHAVHGVPPFPWQDRLAREVAGTGWPAELDIPTGCGKTSAIDVAVFTLALQANQPITQRKAPVRIVFIVDRRLVVDEAFARAQKLAHVLANPIDGVVARVASNLRRLAGEDAAPLAVARLRGGLPREPDWARTPTQPTVLLSTVDQVGSRLLFRGYGVSDSMKPVHAGLLGRDALLILDEAHLSQPFLQTLRDLASPPWAGKLVVSPFQVVSMTATPAGAGQFQLDKTDYADRSLKLRLGAAKPAKLLEVSQATFVSSVVEQVRRLCLAGGGTAQVAGVVVNRVKRARAIFDMLQQEIENGLPAQAALLIGRTRDVDREKLLADLLPRMRAGRESIEGPPLIVVATQCIEAGADIDFDVLVTEVAPLDCLRQRFGRLNRLGRHSTAPAVIIAASDQIGARADDPIYGLALRDTWHFLRGRGTGTADFGIAASSNWMPEGSDLQPLLAPRASAPLLLPRDPHFWSSTSPIPMVDPSVPLYLHGPDASAADVQIVWRKELDPDDKQAWTDWIDACPPTPGEAMSVPIGEARRWLADAASGDVADVEGRDVASSPSHSRRHFRLWRNGAVQQDGGQPRPGDTIMVAAGEGGADQWGWNPLSLAPVEDLADAAMQRTGRQHILRLVVPHIITAELRDQYVEMSDRAVLRDLMARRLVETPRGKLFRRPEAGVPLAVIVSAPDAASEDDLSSLTSRRRRGLIEHTGGVVAIVEIFAERLGLEVEVACDLRLAARLHDAGKAHPDFQRYLYGGDELVAAGGAVLAKGNQSPTSEARRRSGLPDGARHEVASLRLAEAHPDFPTAHDPELVLWLIGTHHGQGRPLFPPVSWPAPDDVFGSDVGGGPVRAKPALAPPKLTARWLALHDRLHSRYGPWWLAHLEAVLRLADHRRSEVESREE